MDAIKVLKRLRTLDLILTPVVLGAIILLVVWDQWSLVYVVLIPGMLVLAALDILERVLENRRRKAPITDPDGESRRSAIRAQVRREIEDIERSAGDFPDSAASSGS